MSIVYAKFYDGVISAVHGPEVGDPNEIRYSVFVFATGGDAVPPITNFLPTVRRHSTHSANVVAAKVGHPCRVSMLPDRTIDVFPYTEFTAFDECGAGLAQFRPAGGLPPPPPPSSGPIGIIGGGAPGGPPGGGVIGGGAIG